MTEEQIKLFESGWGNINSFVFSHDIAEKEDVRKLIEDILKIKPNELEYTGGDGSIAR